MKNILIVGAGAVGQVYGYHFANAGHQVSFFIKEKYRNTLENGVILYNLSKDKQRAQAINFQRFQLISDWSTAAKQEWDQIYLCISSTAFAHFDFGGLKEALNKQTTLVFLQPGPEDYALALEHLSETQLVQGMITLISYYTPLPGESVAHEGVAYWLAPMVPTPFLSKNDTRLTDIIATFRGAGMKASKDAKLQATAVYPNLALMVFLTALEACQWRFAGLKHNRALQRQMLNAIKQGTAAVSAATHSRPPVWLKLLNQWLINPLLAIAPKLFPFDLEAYLEAHFTKVKDQTKLFMNTYVKMAEQHQLPHDALEQLNQLTD